MKLLNDYLRGQLSNQIYMRLYNQIECESWCQIDNHLWLPLYWKIWRQVEGAEDEIIE